MIGIDLDDPRHGKTGADAFPSSFGHRADVMSEHDASLTRGPREDSVVLGPGDGRILHSNQVELGYDPEQSADDLAAEVLVSGKPQRQRGAALPLSIRARSRSRKSWYSGRASISRRSSACSLARFAK